MIEKLKRIFRFNILKFKVPTARGSSYLLFLLCHSTGVGRKYKPAANLNGDVPKITFIHEYHSVAIPHPCREIEISPFAAKFGVVLITILHRYYLYDSGTERFRLGREKT